MGHQWPGAKPALTNILGPGTDDISATRMSLDFFDQRGEVKTK
jgi:poly(3-hydroxybutyrate) depolymerase